MSHLLDPASDPNLTMELDAKFYSGLWLSVVARYINPTDLGRLARPFLHVYQP